MYSRSIIIAVLSVLVLVSAKNNGNNNGMMGGNGNGNNNSVCKAYKNRKGAFGICTSYCKAKKCHLKSTPTNSCLKMKAQFEKKTGETSLPCDPTETPTASPTPEASTDAPSAAPSSAGTSKFPTAAPTASNPPV